jgi:flavin-dependent dehydrogenase
MTRRARRVAGDGFLLVGDAASFLDPFTGEGIYEALRGATLLAPVASAALRANDVSARTLTPYRAARRRAFWAKRQVCWLVQGFIATPSLMDYATTRLDRRPTAALTLAGVLGDLYPAQRALSPVFLARLLRP